MTNLNGHFNPLLDNDSESVLADDEGSDIGTVNIDSSNSASLPDVTLERISDNSSDITLSSLSLPSMEPSSAEENNEKQDVSRVSDFSQQQNTLKEETEIVESSDDGSRHKTMSNKDESILRKEAEIIETGDTETRHTTMDVKEKNLADSDVPSTSKKRALEDYPRETPCLPEHSESEMAVISSKDNFKKFKVSDDSEKNSPETSLSSSRATYISKDFENNDIVNLQVSLDVISKSSSKKEESPSPPHYSPQRSPSPSGDDRIDSPERADLERCIEDYKIGQYMHDQMLRSSGLLHGCHNSPSKSTPSFPAISEVSHEDKESKFVDTSKKITEKSEKDDVKDKRVSSNSSPVEKMVVETDNSNMRKQGKRKLSSPETADTKIKIQKHETPTELLSILDTDSCKQTDSFSSPCQTSEDPINTTYMELYMLPNQDMLLASERTENSSTSDSDTSKQAEKSSYTDLPDSSKLSNNSTGAASVSGTSISSEEQINVDFCKHSPVIHDEDALLSAPDKSHKFKESESTDASKKSTFLKEDKLNISTFAEKNENPQTIEKLEQSLKFSKKIESITLESSENESTTDKLSLLKEESESSSAVSYEQRELQFTGKTSVESQKLSIVIGPHGRNSPVLFDEIAMISPPDRMKETKEFSELSETEEPKTIYMEIINVDKITPELKELNLPLLENDSVSGISSESQSTGETSLRSSSNTIKTSSDESVAGSECAYSEVTKGKQVGKNSSMRKFLSEHFPYKYRTDTLEPIGISLKEHSTTSSQVTDDCKNASDPCSLEQASAVQNVSSLEKTPKSDYKEVIPGLVSETSTDVKAEVGSIVNQLFNRILDDSEQKEVTITDELVSVAEQNETVEDEKREQYIRELDSPVIVQDEHKKQDLEREHDEELDEAIKDAD